MRDREPGPDEEDMTASWRPFIRSYCASAVFAAPVGETAITAVEAALSTRFTQELSSLLRDSNGVDGEYGPGLIWPLEQIEKENLAFRSNPDFRELYMPFDHLLFFADGGNGDQFALAVRGGEIRSDDVFVWNHEDDSRTWVAPSIRTYIEWWLTGRISI